MATSLGSLFIDLSADTGKFESDMGRAARIADQRAKAIEKSITDGIDGSIKKLGQLALAYVALDQTVGRFFRSLDQADELSKASQKIGVSVQALSGLKFAGELSDVNFDALTSGLEKFNKSIVAAQLNTGEQRQAFKALGLSVDDLRRLSPDQLLLKVSDAFAGANDGAQKTAISMALFGKSGADLIPLLNGGAKSINDLRDEAKRLGVVIDDDTAKAAEAFNDNISRMKAAADGLFLKLASKYAPELEKLTSSIADPQFQQGVENWVDKTLELTDALVKAAPELFRIFAAIRGALLGFAVGTPFGPIGQLIGTFAGAAAGEFSPELLSGGLKLSQGIDTTNRKPADQTAAIRAAMANVNLGTENFPAINVAGLNDGKKTLTDLNLQLDDSQQKLEQFKKDLEIYDKDMLKTEASNLEESGKIIDQFRSPDEILQAQHDKLDRLYNAGYLDAETRTRALGAANDEYYKSLAKLDAESDDAFAKLSVYADQAARNMQDAFSDFLFDPFKDGLSGLEENLTQTLQRMTAQILSAQAFASLAGALTSSSNPGLVQLGGILSGKRAAGGPVNAGGLYLVGERGPELFAPSSGGSVIPNGRMPATAGAGAIVNIDIQNNTGAAVQQQEGSAPDGSKLIRIIIGEAQRDIAENGPLSKAMQQTYGLQRAARGR